MLNNLRRKGLQPWSSGVTFQPHRRIRGQGQLQFDFGAHGGSDRKL
jgi:hypothetical protein